MNKPCFEIALTIEDANWGDEAALLPLVQKALQAAQNIAQEPFPKPVEISLLFTNDAHIKNLNHEWREKDKPTNVLSFPALSDADWDNLEQLPQILLGDIILAFETIEDEAKTAQKPFENHLSHLIIHGFLHLLGYDHIEEEMAEEMEAMEIKALAQLNIENPYD